MSKRVIKFRTWDADEMRMKGRFYDGIMIQMTTGRVGWYDDDSNWVDAKDFFLMQFTGFKDCDGVEIYEGDILKATVGLPLSGVEPKQPKLSPDIEYRVVFHEGAFGIKKATGKPMKRLSSLLIRFNGMKVIGNIYNG